MDCITAFNSVDVTLLVIGTAAFTALLMYQIGQRVEFRRLHGRVYSCMLDVEVENMVIKHIFEQDPHSKKSLRHEPKLHY